MALAGTSLPTAAEQDTTTVEGTGACVIDLSAPRETGSCHLGFLDPPARLVVTGWFTAPLLLEFDLWIDERAESDKDADLEELDGLASDFLQSETRDPVDFWGAAPYTAPSTLDAPPGGHTEWRSEQETLTLDASGPEATPLYTRSELEAAREDALRWAGEWKAYREYMALQGN